MIPRSERKQNADAAMASINLDLVATTLLRIISKLRVPKVYAAALPQPRGKSVERAFLWEPLLDRNGTGDLRSDTRPRLGYPRRIVDEVVEIYSGAAYARAA